MPSRSSPKSSGTGGRARAGFIPRLLASLLLLNLLFIGLAGGGLYLSRLQHEDDAAAASQNLAGLLDQDLTALFRLTDLALLSIVQETELRAAAGRLDMPALNFWIERQLDRTAEISALRVANHQGRLTHGSGLTANTADISIADRPYFVHLRGNPDAPMSISHAVRDPLDHAWGLELARPIRLPDGKFAGVVVATIPMSHLTRTFGNLSLGKGATFTLFDDELRIIVRHQDGRNMDTLIGTRFGSQAFENLVRTGQASGTYQVKASLDGIQRMFSYRKIKDTPVNISVGLAAEDFLAEWHREIFLSAAMVVVFFLVTLGMAWFALRSWQSQAGALTALERAHRTLDTERLLTRTIFQSSPFAIYTRDRQGLVTAWNPAAEKLFGWSAEEIIGRPLLSVPPELQQESDQLRDRVLSGETIIDHEVERMKRDGTRFDLSTTLAPLYNEPDQASGYLAIAADITERKAAERQIEFLAYRDVLTGLPNRLLLRDRFEQATAYAERSGTKVALMFLDLDNFKTVNDSLGHAVGDGMLKEIAERLSHCVRDTDTISRQGGDEFLLVLPDLRGNDAITPVLTKIRDRLHQPLMVDGHELTTSASIGIALYPDDGHDFDALLQKADTAMYQAKSAGRNHYRFFDAQMNVEAIEHLNLKNGLRHALDRQEFLLHYQPQTDLRSGRVIGVEALLRWQHPEQGMISPARFIPVAEDSGLIVPIGEWVLQEACRQAMVWRQAGLPELTMAVNLSAVQFRRGDVEHSVMQALRASGLDPRWLELELTESILIKNPEQVFGTVKRLKQQGIKLSIDDFGTGYSSLSYLKRFDVDKLKIDQSFVRDLATDPDDAAIIRAIIQMAHSLDLRTIAEGVEDADTLASLRRFDCDEAQGYFFGRPMPANDLTNLLQGRRGADQSAPSMA